MANRRPDHITRQEYYGTQVGVCVMLGAVLSAAEANANPWLRFLVWVGLACQAVAYCALSLREKRRGAMSDRP